MKKIQSCVLLFLCLVFPFQASSYAASIAGRDILDNGITLLHSEKTVLPIVTVVVAIKAGSVAESPGKSGLANLTADLLKEGTEGRSSKQISDAIEFVGGSLSTSGGSDFITVSLSVLKKDIELGFDLLSDVILNPAFRDDEIKRRKTSIKNSIISRRKNPTLSRQRHFMKQYSGNILTVGRLKAQRRPST